VKAAASRARPSMIMNPALWLYPFIKMWRSDTKRNPIPHHRKIVNRVKKPPLPNIPILFRVPLFLSFGEIDQSQDEDDNIDQQQDDQACGLESLIDCKEAEDRVENN